MVHLMISNDNNRENPVISLCTYPTYMYKECLRYDVMDSLDPTNDGRRVAASVTIQLCGTALGHHVLRPTDVDLRRD